MARTWRQALHIDMFLLKSRVHLLSYAVTEHYYRQIAITMKLQYYRQLFQIFEQGLV
jgi:hypothetical protein